MATPGKKIVLVGSPNVGKSSLFNHLTRRYATISNYPGTTVELFSGTFDGVEVYDTPGIYSLFSITEEERETLKCLMEPGIALVVQVLDAKNLQRGLALTFELLETGYPLILALNMADELAPLGITLDAVILSERLRIPAILTSATRESGVEELKQAIRHQLASPTRSHPFGQYYDFVEEPLRVLETDKPLSGAGAKAFRLVDLFLRQSPGPEEHTLYFWVQKQRFDWAEKLAAECWHGTPRGSTSTPLDRFLMHPIAGFVAVFLILYVGLYLFVGVFGAGVVVDFIQNTVFKQYINPVIINFFSVILPFPHLPVMEPFAEGSEAVFMTSRYTLSPEFSLTFWETIRRSIFDLTVGQYGIITMGLTYALALILPIVFFFFLFFSFMEDSGYFPRLSMLIDRAFKFLGLNGRAVIPLVLGFGCDTMATVVTRILETKRERLLATFLLALAIPCSAQMGAFSAVLSSRGSGVFWSWIAVMVALFFGVGKLAAILAPGEPSLFYMEIPPLRFPAFSNIWTKTKSRMVWYFLEVVPLFVWASIFIWIGQLTGLFQWVIAILKPLVYALGVTAPEKIGAVAETILFGFFRRDYSAAHLYEMQSGANPLILTNLELLTVAVVLTLFLPCVAQFLIMIREHGAKIALFITGSVFFVAFTAGFAINRLYGFLGWLG